MSRPNYIPAERQKKMIDFIEANSCAQIKQLADVFGVSEATVRRDLDELDEQGFVKRTHGGAIKMDQSTSYENKYSEKLDFMTDAKKKIAVKAANLVHDGDTVLLDSGTTTYYIAQQLLNHESLTIITNDLYIALNCPLHPSSTLIVTGGVRRTGRQELVGAQAEQVIRETRVNVAFIGADGVDLSHGVTNANFSEVGGKRLMIEAGMRTVLCCDHSKFGRTALAKICDVSAFSTVICDDELEDDTVSKLRRMGPEVILA